jgi:hypothetical protein
MNETTKYLFAPRNAIDPAEAYRLLRGRDANSCGWWSREEPIYVGLIVYLLLTTQHLQG